MRKIFSTLMLVAAAAMTFASCQREEMNAPKETFSTTLTLNTEVDATKTYLGADNTVLWGENESVTLFVKDSNEEPATTFVNSASTSDFNGEASASFTFELSDIAESASYTIGGIYPASASNDIENKNAEAYKIALPAIQNASVNNYDPSAFIMVLKPETVETIPSTYTASFRRAVALNKITLTNVAEGITSVEITVPEDKALAGRRYFNLTTAESGEVYYGQTNTIKVNSAYTGSSIDVWFCSWGVELAENDQLTIKMTSPTATYTRTISANANGIKFIEGDLNTLKVNMASAEVEVVNDLSGEYLIMAIPEAWQLMSGNNSGYYDRFSTTVSSKVADVVCADFYEIENIDSYVWSVAKMDGGYSLQNKSTSKYLNLTADDNKAHTSDEAVAFDLTITEKVAVVTDKNYSRILRYNSGSPRFAFYESGQQPIYFIPWVEDTTPRISVSKTAISVEADATSEEFTYTVKNITGTPTASVKDGATMTNVSATVENGTVTVIFGANTEETEKTATIKLSYEGAADVLVTITQAAKPAEGETVEYTATYTVTSTSEVEVGGNVPSGATVNYSSTYSNKYQLTSGNSMTFTLSGYDGCTITGVTMSMKSNTSRGAGNMSFKAGTTTIASIETADFNNTSWNGNWSTSYVDITPNVTPTLVGSGEDVVLKIAATANSLYCQSITITYTKSGESGGETPTPDPEEPSTGVSKTATITFGSNSVKIDGASVTGTDSENNNWTITTVGTTSYTSNSAYYQVGSSKKPATSITFTTTLPSTASVSGIEAKFGGFGSTAGDITLKVGDTSVGTGKLNATSDVTVKSTSTASGNKVTVTITNIAKGVKCYYISVNYTE